MKKYLVACLFIVGVTGSAFAAHQITAEPPAKHFAVKDTVGNCSVVDVQRSRASDLRILGSKRFSEGCPGRFWLGLQVQNRQRLTRLVTRRASSRPAPASR